MKVLFQNRYENAWVGGDMYQLHQTVRALNDLGVEATYNPNPYLDVAFCDIIHSFHITHHWVYAHFLNALLHKKPFVVTAFTNGGDKLWPKYQDEIVKQAKAIIVFSEKEKQNFITKYGSLADSKKIHIIPNGIEEYWFQDDPDKQYAMMVGRVEIDKNTLYAMRACKYNRIPLHIFGQMRDPVYAERCNEFADDAIVYHGNVLREELKEYYKKCKVLILPSRTELCPLSVMEAGASGANIVLTKNSLSFTDYPNVWTCDPFDKESVRSAVKKAWEADNNRELADRLKEHTWETVAKKHKEIYENIDIG